MENSELIVNETQTVDSVRYHKLLSVLDRSLSAVVDTFKLDDLRIVFPDLAREIPGKLADSHEQISSYIRNSANSDFQAILMQYEMSDKLASLDTLVKEAAERMLASEERPIPSLSPESINRNRSAAIKRAELTRLKAQLELVKDENAQYLAELSKQRATLRTEHERLEKTISLVDSARMAPILLKIKGTKLFSPFDEIEDVGDLSTLWRVCTKVKDSLENGSRLENLSWRLWHLHQTLEARGKGKDYRKLSPATTKQLEKTIRRPQLPAPKPMHIKVRLGKTSERTEASGSHLRTEPPQTIYLCGVPGVGKTTVLHNALGRLPFPVVRGDLSEIVVSASGTEIADDYVSMALKDLVDRARSATPSVLFVDNFEVLADSEQSESITDLASHIVRFIEGIPDGVVLVLESSVGDAELPRLEIVRSAIGDLLKDSLSIDTLVGQVANVTAGYVARDITALCRQAALRKLRHPPKAELAAGADSLVQSMQQLSLTKDAEHTLLPEWHVFEESLQIVRPSQQLAFESARPSKRWADIGGYEETKHRLQQFVQLAISEVPSKLGIKPPSGVLLYGPSGCGKTAMAQAMIGESNCNVINIRGSELFSKYLGETEARLRQLFEAARAAAPCIVFMDEVDSIAAKREWASVESGGPALRVLSTLLNEMDGVHDTRGVVVIGCTNQLDKIDDAIARPAEDVSIDRLSDMTAGFTSANIERLFNEAGLSALRRDINASTIDKCDFEKALIACK
ncbi:hypothetical protein GGF49_005290 [Coemansia sp. RSA 1853]|nr:hypothetical protein GGF49_005290 [Coemansia sp. RSA 1853]